MKITADTNVLIRAIIEDDPRQAKLAHEILEKAETIAVTLSSLCEVVWVLSSVYDETASDIADAIRRLVNGANVSVDHNTVQAGLAMMEANGDFADGVIAHEGNWLGGETFVSFDKQAVKSLMAQGIAARLLA